MGYSLDLFLDRNINEEFLCSICQDVLQEVTMVHPCEHVFCKACIEEWRTSANTCPIDRQNIDEFKTPQRVFMNLLNSLQLRCPFTPVGCEVVTKLGELRDHDERCEFNPENHKECVGGCGAVVKQWQVKTHNCVAHLKDQLRIKTDELVQYKIRFGDLESASSSSPDAKKARVSGTLGALVPDRVFRNSSNPSASIPHPTPELGSQNSTPVPIHQVFYTNRKNVSELLCDKIIKIVSEELVTYNATRNSRDSAQSKLHLSVGIRQKLNAMNIFVPNWEVEVKDKDQIGAANRIPTVVKSRIDLSNNELIILIWRGP